MIEDYMKTCTKCKEEKLVNNFYRKRAASDGLFSYCKVCEGNRVKKYWSENKDKWRKTRRLSNNNYRWKHNYGIDFCTKKYNEMFEQQNGCCKICNTHQSKLNRSLHVDHCHKTKEVRGLLCSGCNTGLGLFIDNKEFLLNACKYLKGEL